MSEVKKGFKMRSAYWFLLTLVVIAIFAIFLSREIVVFWLNLSEFGDLFIKPVYFGLLGGLALAALALFRVDFKNRRSITWWLIRLVIRLIRAGGRAENASPEWFDFASFKMSPLKFFVWQITKVLAGMVFFTNVMFGMALDAVMLGWNPGLEMLPKIFGLPFTTPPMDLAYAEATVIPLIPALTLLIPAVLRALWIRIILLVAITHLIRIIMHFNVAYLWGLERLELGRFLPIVQALGAVFLLWFMFNMFFTDFIDYNTRYPILGLGVAGAALAVFAHLDGKGHRARVHVRVGAIVMIALVFGSVMLINNSV
ncbi:MAG: hypothetical protein ACUVUE_04830, partial [Candidatus Bathycorpusculaceae bacterium]